MKKFRLLTPGPTAIPEKVLAKFAEPVVHHRTSIFEAEFKNVQENQNNQRNVHLHATTSTKSADSTVVD